MKARPVSLFAIGSGELETVLRKPDSLPKLENHAGKDLDANTPQTAFWTLASPDQDRLAQLALEAPDQNACRAAFEKITNQTLLAELALEGSTDFIRIAAIPRVTDEAVLEKFALNARLIYINPDIEARVQDLEKLTCACVGAVGKITDQSRLARLAVEAESSDVRKAALKKLTNQDLLAKIALLDKDFVVRFSAVDRLTSPNTLGKIAKDDKNAMVRSAAAKRLAQLSADGN